MSNIIYPRFVGVVGKTFIRLAILAAFLWPQAVVFNVLAEDFEGSDKTPPVSTVILIDFGNSVTNSMKVKLTLGAADASGVASVMLSNDPDFTGAQWETYFETKFWTLTEGDGQKTVYAKFKDTPGNVSRVVSATIKLDSKFNMPSSVKVSPVSAPLVCPISSEDEAKLRVEISELKKSLEAERADKKKILEIAQIAKKSLEVAQVASSAAKVQAGILSKELSVGSSGSEVNALQNFLKAQGENIYPEGRVTGYFGPATTQAIKRFQEKHGIAAPGDLGYGELGPKTRSTINWLSVAPVNVKAALEVSASSSASSTPAAAPSPSKEIPPGITLRAYLKLGAKGEDVSIIQSFLKAQGESIYPEGQVTGYFGPATVKAIKKFQEKYGIAAPGDEGYGEFGPRTRAKVNELLSQQS